MEKNVPYLCGGTLFFLLVQAKKPRAKSREREKGIKDGLDDPSMMTGLISAITGYKNYAYPGSLKKNTSEFRECRIEGSAYIPFNDLVTANKYDDEIRHKYDEVLYRMAEFTDVFLSPEKASWLGRALIDAILQDSGIGAETLLYIKRDGCAVPAGDLRNTQNMELQSLLVGIVHYILMNRTNNKMGLYTLEIWGEKSSRSERKLRREFSLGSGRDDVIGWLDCEIYRTGQKMEKKEQDDAQPTTENGGDCKEPESEHDAQQTQDKMDGIDSNSTCSAAKSQQQINVVQHGEKNINLVNNGTININF